jgi:hypothetical protein
MANDGTTELLQVVVPGVQTEMLGAGNQPWDQAVRMWIGQALADRPARKVFSWYSIEARWFVYSGGRRRDLDNFRIKPALDALTEASFWPDDNIFYVRRIVSEAVLVGERAEERLQFTVYGHLGSGSYGDVAS